MTIAAAFLILSGVCLVILAIEASRAPIMVGVRVSIIPTVHPQPYTNSSTLVPLRGSGRTNVVI